MLLAISFIATFGLILSAGLLLFYRDVMLDRLQEIVDRRSESAGGRFSRLLQRRPAVVENIVKPFQNVVPRTQEETSVIQKRLIRAGYRQPSAINIFYGAKVLVPLSLAILATITQAYQVGPFFVYAVSVTLGFLLPDFWLGNRISHRQKKVRLGLPETLDLLVICTEAGLGLDQALFRVAKELKLSQPEIHEELILLNLEQKAGLPRREALKNLADRIDLDSVRALVTTLVQADTFGTSIAKTLRVYSDSLRTQRRQQAEEQAAKTTVKLVFPLVFFIFPSIFLVALGPSAISLWEGMEKYLLS
jgi:tight adherence protein C